MWGGQTDLAAIIGDADPSSAEVIAAIWAATGNTAEEVQGNLVRAARGRYRARQAGRRGGGGGGGGGSAGAGAGASDSGGGAVLAGLEGSRDRLIAVHTRLEELQAEAGASGARTAAQETELEQLTQEAEQIMQSGLDLAALEGLSDHLQSAVPQLEGLRDQLQSAVAGLGDTTPEEAPTLADGSPLQSEQLEHARNHGTSLLQDHLVTEATGVLSLLAAQIVNPQRPSLDHFTAELRSLLLAPEDASLRPNPVPLVAVARGSSTWQRASWAFWAMMSAGAGAQHQGIRAGTADTWEAARDAVAGWICDHYSGTGPPLNPRPGQTWTSPPPGDPEFHFCGLSHEASEMVCSTVRASLAALADKVAALLGVLQGMDASVLACLPAEMIDEHLLQGSHD